MSSTINLLDRLLITARRLHDTGRTNDAFTRFHQLTRFRDLPGEVAAECHLRMGEMLLHRRKPNRARKHFKAVLRQIPDHARAHQLLGDAQQGGRLPDPYAAMEHYRKALALQPDQVECLCAAGRLATEQGLAEEGLGYLRKAAALATDDADMMRKVVDALLLANQADEARRLVRASLFRNGHDRRFRGLWTHLQFQQLRQQQGESQARKCQEAESEPVLLAFVKSAEEEKRPRKQRVIRHDSPATLNGPHREAVLARLPRPRFAR